MAGKRFLILDMIHGGDIIAEELVKRGDEPTCVDVYHNCPEENRQRMLSLGCRVLASSPDEEFDMLLSPAHCPDSFIAPARCKDRMTFSGAVNMLIDDSTKRIEVTGVKGKTSTCYLLSHILDAAGENVFLHTSRGQGAYHNGVHEIERTMSIAPTSLLRLPKGYGLYVCEVSLGGSGKADAAVITNLLEDYGIAKDSRKASDAKAEILTDGVNFIKEDEVQIWSRYGDRRFVTFKETVDVIGEPRIGDGIKVSFDYSGERCTAVMNGGYLALQYIKALATVLPICSYMKVKKETLIEAIATFKGVPGRGEIVKKGDAWYVTERNPGISHLSVGNTMSVLDSMHALDNAFVIVDPVSKKVCDKMKAPLIKDILNKYPVEYVFTDGINNDVEIPEGKRTVIRFIKEGFQ